ncbi:nucleotidyltransferase domain-containing protein [Clostridium cellulovorans]|uniref:DNA polymerase beta domain protein region n=1 Tax=Clostridium cellulovorans (strain ATCC 35296 / DSM 3052 / OCM 3 / 743B) TaxID=573061 RepID=D9SNE5_CLOC7|nr:nucleotidyltransferase domain-containing protein [Clostridium cellulovorans]ADL53937.1 DNA polymerase beta domain protein region [Clostridium cellulovorans 743B]
MYINKETQNMLNEFSQLQEVEGILLAGSYATKTNDKNSDYDIYIYVTNEIAIEKRKTITGKYCSYMELNNNFWETEDDGVLKESGVPIEIIYRNLDAWDKVLSRILIKYEADTGYTTCFWANVLNSVIIYDKNGSLNKLQEKYSVPYPRKLKENIISKNYPLLKLQMPAYYHQIEKALKRDDYVSVNHRVAALFASYFDIIFAINEMPHPGEKKLLKIIKDNNLKIPLNMNENVNNILRLSSLNNTDILVEIDKLIYNLDMLLKKEDLW